MPIYSNIPQRDAQESNAFYFRILVVRRQLESN